MQTKFSTPWIGLGPFWHQHKQRVRRPNILKENCEIVLVVPESPFFCCYRFSPSPFERRLAELGGGHALLSRPHPQDWAVVALGGLHVAQRWHVSPGHGLKRKMEENVNITNARQAKPSIANLSRVFAKSNISLSRPPPTEVMGRGNWKSSYACRRPRKGCRRISSCSFQFCIRNRN